MPEAHDQTPLSVDPSPVQPLQGSATGWGRGHYLPPHPPIPARGSGLQQQNQSHSATLEPIQGALGPLIPSQEGFGGGVHPLADLPCGPGVWGLSGRWG